VGIAGEDDLDAPDLTLDPPGPNTTHGSGTKLPNGHGSNGLNDHRTPAQSRSAKAALSDGADARPVRALKRTAPERLPSLSTPESGALCEQLLGEIRQLTSADEAAMWAKASLPKKNRLIQDDAQRVELGFTLALSKFDENNANDARRFGNSNAVARSDGTRASRASAKRPVVAKTIRLRDPEHRKFVALQPCLVCGRQPCDAHHLRFAQPRAMGSKVSDEFTVPLCRTHHRQAHRRGHEQAFWADLKIDPLAIAERLWRRTCNERLGIATEVHPASSRVPRAADGAKSSDVKTNPVTVASR
jgi:hypothetical protein